MRDAGRERMPLAAGAAGRATGAARSDRASLA